MNPVETVQALQSALLELRPATAYGVVGSRDVDQARYRKAIDDALALLASMQSAQSAAPAPRVVEGLTEDEKFSLATNALGFGVLRDEDKQLTFEVIEAAQAECASKWGLTIKENTDGR